MLTTITRDTRAKAQAGIVPMKRRSAFKAGGLEYISKDKRYKDEKQDANIDQ